MRLRKSAKRFRNALFLRHAAQVRDVDAAPRLFDAEAQQRAEGLTRRGANPVRIAAPGVQHLSIAFPFAFGRQRNEFVLEFEGTQLEQVPLFSAGGLYFFVLTAITFSFLYIFMAFIGLKKFSS